MTYRDRYRLAYLAYTKATAPTFYEMSGGEKMRVTIPPVSKANGLTKFCTNYLTYIGAYGNRIQTMGRLVDGKEKQASGAVLSVKKWIPTNTKKGTADIHGILFGLHLSIEIKVGRDRMRPDQEKERERVTRAGGLYWIVKTPEDFFRELDKVLEGKKYLSGNNYGS